MTGAAVPRDDRAMHPQGGEPSVAASTAPERQRPRFTESP